jgi:hypothetical protein
MMESTVEEIRAAAFKNLHLIYVKRFDRTSYRVVKSEDEGTPVLVEYISFHYKILKIRVKDIGSNIIYLVNAVQYRKSRVKNLIKKDNTLEVKIMEWYPFIWGDISDEDKIRYKDILRTLKQYADLENSLEKNVVYKD